jgi:hypothetical protein
MGVQFFGTAVVGFQGGTSLANPNAYGLQLSGLIKRINPVHRRPNPNLIEAPADGFPPLFQLRLRLLEAFIAALSRGPPQDDGR